MDEREARIEAARKRVEAAAQSTHLADHAVVVTVEGMLEDRRLGVLDDHAWERLRARLAAAKRAEAEWLAAGRALDEALLLTRTERAQAEAAVAAGKGE